MFGEKKLLFLEIKQLVRKESFILKFTCELPPFRAMTNIRKTSEITFLFNSMSTIFCPSFVVA